MGKESEKKPDNEISVNLHDFTVNNDQSLSTWYIISALKQHFGYFLVHNKGSANLAWRGKMDIGQVEESVSDLSKIILDKEVDFSNPEVGIGVIFNTNNGEEYRYNLRDRLDYESYNQRLSDGSSTDIRYLLSDDYQDKSFLFHVRNANDPNKMGLGIALPQKSQFFTSQALPAWVMKHHWFGESFEAKGVKPENVFSKIKGVLGS